MDAGIGQFIPLILIFVIFYFFLIRPQQKKVKDHKIMVENLKRGDKVITTGGIVGTIDRIIDNEKVEVEIKYKSGDIKKIKTLCRIDTKNELEYYKNGGILQYVLRKML